MPGAKTWISVLHYEVREDLERPAWMKMRRDLLGDLNYFRLNDRERALYADLRMIALEYHNRIPNDPGMLAKLRGRSGKIDISPLQDAGLVKVHRRKSLARHASSDRQPSTLLSVQPSGIRPRQDKKEKTRPDAGTLDKLLTSERKARGLNPLGYKIEANEKRAV